MKLSIVVLFSLLVAIGALVLVAADADVQKFETAGDCATNCALNSFNKFDHEEFNRSGKCHCYKDEVEFKFNNQHGTLKSKILAQ